MSGEGALERMEKPRERWTIAAPVTLEIAPDCPTFTWCLHEVGTHRPIAARGSPAHCLPARWIGRSRRVTQLAKGQADDHAQAVGKAARAAAVCRVWGHGLLCALQRQRPVCGRQPGDAGGLRHLSRLGGVRGMPGHGPGGAGGGALAALRRGIKQQRACGPRAARWTVRAARTTRWRRRGCSRSIARCRSASPIRSGC